MIKKIFKKQNFLIIIAIILFVWLTKVNASSNSQLVSIKDSSDIDRVGKETLEVLLALKSLKLDDSFFERPVFKKLIDFSIELEEKDKGRYNPFEDFASANDTGYGVDVGEEDEEGNEESE